MKEHSQYLKMLSLTFSMLKMQFWVIEQSRTFIAEKFGSQHPCGGSQASVTPDLGVQCFPLTSWSTGHTCGAHIYMQANQSYQ